MDLVVNTSGLNSYAHTYLTLSGKMLLQANLSTVLLDPKQNVETPLPEMPNGVTRVYPSDAVAMLSLTPANNYAPTLLFCGGSDMPADYYGDYSWPFYNTWMYPASTDCQRLTPEPQGGSLPIYKQDDDMLEKPTMGQFITLPDGTLLAINGAPNGTAGFASQTLHTPSLDQMAFYVSLASGTIGKPAIYNPNAPRGSRWSNVGLGSSNISRMYHSSAILPPDASMLVAGRTQTWKSSPTWFIQQHIHCRDLLPAVLCRSGAPAGMSANMAAAKTFVVLARGGFATHATNMGQRHLRPNNTHGVNRDGSYVLHVSQVPPNPNLLTPGPALLFVVVNWSPSNGMMVIVGPGKVEKPPTVPVAVLPPAQMLTAA